jgi:hypothetical protein
MRAVLALTALAAALLAGPAAAEPSLGEPYGSRCGWSSVTDPRSDGDTQVAELDAELVVLDAAGRPASGTLTCTLQVGYPRHADPDAASASAAGTGVVALAATVTYQSPYGMPVYWCTQFAYDGGPTLYWAREYDDADSHWSTDPATSCDYFSPDPEPDPGPFRAIERAGCPVLDALGPTDPAAPVYVEDGGDVYAAGIFLWDCPPYDL